MRQAVLSAYTSATLQGPPLVVTTANSNKSVGPSGTVLQTFEWVVAL